MKLLLKLSLMITCSLFMLACAKDVSPSNYDADQIGYAAQVEPGVIVSMRNINIDRNTGVGAVAGAGAGAVAGSTIGGSSTVGAITAIGGAVLGGLAGNAAEGAILSKQGVEYIIKLDNGSTLSSAQANGLNLYVGQRVNVIYGKTTRIVPDDTQSLKGA